MLPTEALKGCRNEKLVGLKSPKQERSACHLDERPFNGDPEGSRLRTDEDFVASRDHLDKGR